MNLIDIKPKILISKCIEHDNCRYDASMISSDFVNRIKKYVEFVTVCPELSIGLSVPRESLRIVYENGEKFLKDSECGKDHSYKMEVFSENFSSNISSNGIHGAILKSRSPTCGFKDVKMYAGLGKKTCLPQKSPGYFGGIFKDYMENLPIEDEGRLKNYDIREHFLTRIFTMAYFDYVKESKKISELVKFHSEYKYLLMAYDQIRQKELGAIVANHSDNKIDELLDKYGKKLGLALSNPMQKGKNTNMIHHMFGYVSSKLSSDEKLFFLDQLELYNQNKKPLSVVLTLLYAWIIRFEVNYLKDQKIFAPYPLEILDVMDSGKGIK